MRTKRTIISVILALSTAGSIAGAVLPATAASAPVAATPFSYYHG
jgi:hypothetical protein